MPEHLFDEMKRYVGFGADDEALLRGLGAEIAPHLDAIVGAFYERIGHHSEALAVVERHSSIERLARTLRVWIERFFTGPWDRAYYEERARIGRRHVEIGLPQHYMLTGMHVIRERTFEAILTVPGDEREHEARRSAVSKLIDLELAIMLHTYREDYLRERQRRERLATFGLLTSTVAHELRNPLAVMDTSLYLLREHVPEGSDGRRHLDKIQAQVRRSNRLIASLLDLVRERPPQLRRVRPQEIAESAVRAILETRGTRVGCEISAGLLEIEVDADQIEQILVNLLSNAADAAGPHGGVRLAVEAARDRVRFRVSDSGPGIDAAVAGRLFEPLVTTKEHGVGLGLALCRKLASAHRGSLELGAGPLGGATFVLELPARQG